MLSSRVAIADEDIPVRYRPSADQDLFDIAEYVLDCSADLQTSRAYVARIYARCERIGDISLGGVPRDDLGAGMRRVVFERTVVIRYAVHDDTVWITNIMSGGRDYEMLFDRRGNVPPEDIT